MSYYINQGVIVPYIKKYNKFLFLAVAGIFIFTQFVMLLGPVNARSENANDPKNDEEEPKVWICHAPRSDKFLALYIDKSGAENGHGGGQGTHSDDIVPPFEGFAGLNWTTENQAYWEKNCDGSGEVIGDNCTLGPAFAFKVEDSDQGTRKNGSAVLAARSDPNNALGATDALFFSLGFDGWIEVEFDGYIVDGAGDDITFSETTNGVYPQEIANIEVSKDGAYWVAAGSVNNTGDNGVDLTGTGLDWVKYVRATEASNTALFESTADGYDLNSIGANIVCTKPADPEEPIELCAVTLNSDTSNTVNEKADANAVLVSSPHPAWVNEATLSGSEWIWGDDPVVDETIDTYYTFKKSFYWTGPITSANIQIAADNSYEIWINNVSVISDSNIDNFSALDMHNIFAYINSGASNTIEIKIKNWAWDSENPAGLLYKAVISGTDEDCAEQPQVIDDSEEENIGRIQGVIYNDENGNNTKQPNEPYLEGWNALLLTKNSPYRVAGIDTTDENGDFLFENLAFGTYYVCQDLQSGWLQTQKDADGNGIDVDGLELGETIPDDVDTLDALVEKYCYNVVLSDESPESINSIFGNHQNRGGSVLGDSTTKEEPNDETTGGQGGAVLADTDTLSSTGDPVTIQVIIGLVIIGIASTLFLTNKKSSIKNK